MLVDTILLAIMANKGGFAQYQNITKLLGHDNIDQFPDLKKSIQELLIFDRTFDII